MIRFSVEHVLPVRGLLLDGVEGGAVDVGRGDEEVGDAKQERDGA